VETLFPTMASPFRTNGATAERVEPERRDPRPRPERPRIEPAAQTARLLVENVSRVVRGKEHEIRLVVAAFASSGQVLIEDVPGTAKTVLARALAQSIERATVARIQCTPDLQPTDITGLSVFNQKSRDFEFHPGPIFANVVLLDEVNRAMPKTQSALLEAMAETQATVDGVTRSLPSPFLLLATENPIEQEGTFPLPEAQLDRFFVRISLGYPSAEEEFRIVVDRHAGSPLDELRPVAGLAEIRALQEAVDHVYIDELIRRWIVALVRATRQLPFLELPASVRGSLALDRAARAWALLEGRDHVVPEDVELLFAPVVGHRVLFGHSYLSETRGLDPVAAFDRFWSCCLDLAPRPHAP
jgi:MoxR-like ATPase